MEEAELHRLIKEDKSIQKEMLKALKIEDNDITFNSEDQFPNGLWADFTILKGKEVKAIIELKGSNIGVNEFVRGTGQVFQYQHFINHQMSIKDYKFTGTMSVYCFPSSLLEGKPYNIGLFSYPVGCKIMLYNEETKTFRVLTEKDLQTFAGVKREPLISVSPYYIRDTRLFEIYIALKYFEILKLSGYDKIDRKQSEIFLKRLETPDNGNWRNVFISLSSLGFTDSDNIPTTIGSKFVNYSFEEFAYEVYNAFIKNYFSIIISVLLNKDAYKNSISLSEIKDEINALYRGKDVLFMTDSDNRYLSSWLNLMQDDYGCISYEANKAKRTYKIVYPINKFNKEAICEEIRKHSKAYEYINKFNALVKASI